jgi:hypothetical protein
MSIWIKILAWVATEVAKELLRMAIEYSVDWAIAQYRKKQQQ